MALALVCLNVFLHKSFVDCMTSCDAHEKGYISQFKLRFFYGYSLGTSRLYISSSFYMYVTC